MSGHAKVVLSLPGKLWGPAEEESTKWFIIQLLDPKLDWRASLADARLRVDGDSPALQGPYATGLGLQVDHTATPAQMLVLKPSADGSNTVLPAGRVASCIKIGNQLSNSDMGTDKSGSLKLVPLPTGEISNNVPVAYWRLGPSIPEDELLRGLSFECVTPQVTNRKGELIGSFKAAPKMQLVGRPLKLTDATYLVGALPQGSKKLFLYEAEVYWVERNGEFGRNKAEEQRQEAEDRKKIDFRTARSEAVQFGAAAKKKRQDASRALRMVDDNKVADLDDCMAELTARANSFEDMGAIKENDAQKLKQELLPQFDLTATEPRQIYAKGIERMLPEWIIKAENSLRDDRMTVFLQSPVRINETPLKELEEVFKSRFGARLVQARAAANVSETYDDAELTARRFSALHILLNLCKAKKPRLNFVQFLQELNLQKSAATLSNHLFDYFMKPSPVDVRTRIINRKKLVCHLIVLVLDLSLRYKVDLQPMQEELSMEVKEMEENARYLGCEIAKKKNPDNAMQTLLETQLKAPLTFPPRRTGGRKRKK